MERQSLIRTRDVTDLPAIAPAVISRSEYAAEPQTGSLLDYWHAIGRRKITLVSLGIAGLAIGIGIALMQTPMYRASTSLEIQDAKDDNLGTKILNPQPDSAAPDSTTDIQTQVKILQSHSLIARALGQARVFSLADLDRQSTQRSPLRKFFPSPHPRKTATVWWRR